MKLIPLTEVLEGCFDEQTVGGKALRLARLHAAGFRVKPAFVLPAADVAALSVNPDNLDLVLSDFPAHRYSSFAVRSSAAEEDGDLSWAGQFKSLLFIPGRDLKQAILECAQAAESAQVKAYAKTHGVAHSGLALIIQEMVDAQISGVGFSREPLSNDPALAVIEVVQGVSHDFVSGSVAPRRYYFDALTGRLVQQDGEGAAELPDTVARELLRALCRLSEMFGRAQDVEWAVDQQDQLYFNQTRDITHGSGQLTVTPLSLKRGIVCELGVELDEELGRLADLGCKVDTDVLSDTNIVEILTEHPAPLSLGLFNYGFGAGNGGIRTGRNELTYRIGAELDRGLFVGVAGTPRCSIVHDALTFRISGIPLSDYSRLVNYYLERIKSDRSLANYPEVGLYNQNPDKKFLAEVFGRKSEMYSQLYYDFFARLYHFEQSWGLQCQRSWLPAWRTKLGLWQDLPTDSVPELVAAFRVYCDLLRDDACRAFVKTARLGFFAYSRLRNMLKDLEGSNADFVLNSISAATDSADNPNLLLPQMLAGVKSGQIDLSAVLAKFGHLSPHELDIATPRYRDSPEILEQMAQNSGQVTGPGNGEAQLQAAAIMRRLIAKAGRRGQELAETHAAVRTYLPLRETVKFEFLKAYARLRDLVISLARHLDWPEDLAFWLLPEEIFRLNLSSSSARELMELALARKSASQATRNFHVPQVMFADELHTISTSLVLNQAGVLKGIGVSNYACEGTAVVIDSLANLAQVAELQPGNILVTSTTDPAWSAALAIVGPKGGLVTEVGGLLAHGAIYAREAKMAAVLNVPFATKLIKTGDRIRVDGTQGLVTVL